MSTIYLNIDWISREINIVPEEFALKQITDYKKSELYSFREVNLGVEHFVEDEDCDTSIIVAKKVV